MRPGRRWHLSLQGKLLGMMFGLLVLVLATLFLLYWRAETQLISQVERHTTDLSTAIQVSVEQLTSRGRTTEARLQDYVQRLQRRGIREISIVSNEEEVIASSNPRRVGARVDPKRKDLLITARLGEEIGGGRGQKTYNIFVPIVVGNQRSGYILVSMILDDFAELARVNFLKRLVATVLVFAVGIAGTAALAWTYAKPISRVVEAARRVAQGHLDERLPANRRDEIGELNRSFNEMVEGLREKAELVTGSIVGFTQQGSEGTQNCSVVAYQTSSGETFQHFSNQCGFGQNIGDPIELYYDPADPESVQVKSFTSTWLAALLLGIPGAISAALGVLFLPRYTKILKNLTS